MQRHWWQVRLKTRKVAPEKFFLQSYCQTLPSYLDLPLNSMANFSLEKFKRKKTHGSNIKKQWVRDEPQVWWIQFFRIISHILISFKFHCTIFFLKYVDCCCAEFLTNLRGGGSPSNLNLILLFQFAIILAHNYGLCVTWLCNCISYCTSVSATPESR